MVLGFFAGPGAKNLPYNAGDTRWIPKPGKISMLRSTQAHESQLLKPLHLRACAPQQEKTLQ